MQIMNIIKVIFLAIISCSIIKSKAMGNSISEKIHVNINGVSQGMFIKGNNMDNPILLFLHGGPGMPARL